MLRHPETGAVPAAYPRPTGLRCLPARPSLRSAGWLALCLAVAAVGVLTAYYRIFSNFSSWDDEGNMMLAVKNFLDGRRLYEDVYTHYGPFYYLANWLAFRPAGLRVDHDTVRIITVCLWAAVCVSGAFFVYRLTRSGILAVLTQVALLSHMGALIYEPGHPQGLVCVLLALALVASSFYTPGRRAALGLTLGAITGALLLTKANIGGFLLIALALSFLLPGSPDRATLVLRVLVTLAALALPVALTRPLLHTPPAQHYLLAAVLWPVPIILVGWGHETPGAFRWRDGVSAALGCAFTMLLTCGLAVWHGTSVHGILDGVVFQHTGSASILAGAFADIPDVGLRGFAWACGGVCLCLFYLAARRRAGRPARWARHGFSALKLAFGALLLFSSYRSRGVHLALMPFLFYATPLLWLALVPDPAKPAPGQFFPRLFLVSLAVLESLQAYPVFGNQVGVGTFLMAPAAALCVHDVLSGMGVLAPAPGAAPESPGAGPPATPAAAAGLSPHPQRPGGGARLRRLAGRAVVILAVALCVRDALLASRIYKANFSLGLPGAGRLRLTEREVATYNWLACNLRASSDTFISAPEIDSLYFWTGIEPPTRLNANCWMTFFTEEQQRAIRDGFARHPRGCVVRYRPGLEMYYGLDTRGPVDPDHDTRPLMDYINRGCKTVGRVGDYEFLVPRTRDDVELVYCARLDPRPGGDAPPSEGAPARPGNGSGRGGRPALSVASLRLPPMAGRTAHEVVIYDAASGAVLDQVVLEADVDLGTPGPLSVLLTREVPVGPQSFTVARLLDRHGRLIASVPFLR
jgi:hypothetical protein